MEPAADGREKRVSLKIDLKTGTIELDAPAESFNDAVEKTKDLAATLDLQGRYPNNRAQPAESPGSTSSVGLPNAAPIQPSRGKAKSNRSGERAGRIGSYEPIPQMLTEEQQIEIMSIFAEKSPSDQSDRVLTAMVKGEELLKRRGLIYNEIYTLMWLAGIKDLPKALDVVLGKMIQDQWVIREGGGFAVKFIGRNRVENELPK
jgi:hypothetical protein